MSSQLLFLSEMFETLEVSWIEHLIIENKDKSIHFLVEACLKKTEETENDEKSDTLPTSTDPNVTAMEMVTLLPANTTPGFFNGEQTKLPDTETPESKQDSTKPMPMDVDIDLTSDTNIDIDQTSMAHSTSVVDIPSYFKPFWEEISSKNKDVVRYIQDVMLYLDSEVQSADLSPLLMATDMVYKLMNNIQKNPSIDKYRSIRTNNRVFVKKITPMAGHKILLQYCGWDFVAEDGDSQGLFIFSSNFHLQNIHDILRLLHIFKNHVTAERSKRQSEKTSSVPNKSSMSRTTYQNIPIVAHRPSKKRKLAHERRIQRPRYKKPRILSPEQLREKRLQNLSGMTNHVPDNYTGVGPRADKIMDLAQPNLTRELREVRKKTAKKWRNTKMARKRVYTMADIHDMRKDELNYRAKGIPSTHGKTGDMDAIGKEALRLTNEFRKTQGLPPLQWHQGLADIGKVHSKNMGDGKVPFGHDGFHDRVKQYPFRHRSAAENVAMSGGLPEVAKVAVNGWIDSPGHRKNMLAHHDFCGIGVYRTPDNRYYLTQLFGLSSL